MVWCGMIGVSAHGALWTIWTYLYRAAHPSGSSQVSRAVLGPGNTSDNIAEFYTGQTVTTWTVFSYYSTHYIVMRAAYQTTTILEASCAARASPLGNISYNQSISATLPGRRSTARHSSVTWRHASQLGSSSMLRGPLASLGQFGDNFIDILINEVKHTSFEWPKLWLNVCQRTTFGRSKINIVCLTGVLNVGPIRWR